MMITLVNASSDRIPLADGLVHCCVTSPPYWGLRDYGLPPRVWGGSAGCLHVWGHEMVEYQRGKVGGKSTLDGGLQARGEGRIQEVRQGQFCQKCGAWLGCLGLEPTPELYVEHLVEVFREVRRVLRDDGTVWLNLGDSYAQGGGTQVLQTKSASHGLAGYRHPTPGLAAKQLIGIPWRVAFALQADGWWLRSDIIWHKPNCMPESVRDRPTKSHEYLFLLSKSKSYFYDQDAIREPAKGSTVKRAASGTWNNMEERPDLGYPGQNQRSKAAINRDIRAKVLSGEHPMVNKRTVWEIATKPYRGAHFATFPPALVEPCIKAGTSERGVCPECGGPWERVIVKELIPQYESRHGGYHAKGGPGGMVDLSQTWVPGVTKVTTTGWRPACSCPEHDPIPAMFLDPFVGSGTTLIVARALGRNGIGLDLSFDYLRDQAIPRLELDKLREWGHGVKTGDNGLGELPLFAEVAVCASS